MKEIGATRYSSGLLSGLRFHVVEHFTGTTGKAVEDTITCLGGSVEQRQSPWTIEAPFLNPKLFCCSET